jgi:hypothetical protein
MSFLAHITLADLSIVAALALAAFVAGALFVARSVRRARR